jgi:hypothetical protein
MTLRLHVGQMSHWRNRAYPSPNDPPPIERLVSLPPSLGQTGSSPWAKTSRIRCSSSGEYRAVSDTT